MDRLIKAKVISYYLISPLKWLSSKHRFGVLSPPLSHQLNSPLICSANRLSSKPACLVRNNKLQAKHRAYLVPKSPKQLLNSVPRPFLVNNSPPNLHRNNNSPLCLAVENNPPNPAAFLLFNNLPRLPVYLALVAHLFSVNNLLELSLLACSATIKPLISHSSHNSPKHSLSWRRPNERIPCWPWALTDYK